MIRCLLIAVFLCGCSADMSVHEKLSAGFPVTIAIIGDSTSEGFGANGADNWNQSSPYAIPFTGYVPQHVVNNVGIPSAPRLLQTWLESVNPNNKLYNYGASGYKASDHVSANIVATIAARTPKPDAVIIALGINSAKNNQSQASALATLVNQIQANGMQCIISLGHNVAYLNTTTPMPFWINMRAEMKAIAASYGCDVIDPGSDDNAINPSFTHDGYHPSALGYQDIFKAYRKYFGGEVSVGGVMFRTTENGALRIKTDVGVIKLDLVAPDDKYPVRVKINDTVYAIKN